MAVLPNKIGPRINLALVVFFVLLAIAAAVVLFVGFRRTQDNATEESRAGLEELGSESIADFSGSVAYSAQLLTGRSAIMGEQAARYFVDLKRQGGAIPWQRTSLTQGAGGEFSDVRPDRATDVWVPANVAFDAAVERDLEDSAALGALFPSLLAANPDAVAIYYANPQGVTRYYPPIGLAATLGPTISPEMQANFQLAAPQNNPERKTLWTPPYDDPAGNGLMVSTNTPIFDGDDFRGIIGVDVSLTALLAQADEVKITPGGYAFVMDRNGELLPTRAVDIVRAAAEDGENEQFAATLAAMRSGESGVDLVNIDGQDVFVGYASLGDVGGSIALVAPQSELTAQADEVAASIDDEANRTLGFALLTLGAFFLVALAGAAYLGRRVLLRPIGALVDGTRAVAAGDLLTKIPIRTHDEFGQLAESFNVMTTELANNRAQIDERSLALEAEIAERTKIEADLRRSEELYRTLAHNFPNGAVVLFDHDLRYTIADGKGLLDAGISSEQLEGRTIYEVFPSEVVDVLEGPFRGALAGNASEFEMSAIGIDYLIYTLPLKNQDEEIFAGMAMVQDITRRKRAEEELRRERDFNEAIVGNAGALVVVLDPEGRFVRFNRAAELTSGYTFDEVRGRAFWDVVIDAEHQEEMQGIFAELASGEYPKANENYWLTKDGRRRYTSWLNTVMLDAEGAVAYYVCTGIDITEQRESEKLLRERELQYRGIFEATSDALFIADLDNHVVDANPAACAMHGYTLDEMRALAPFSLMHERSREYSGEYLSVVRAGGEYRSRALAARKDGSSFPVDLVSMPIVYLGAPHVLSVERDVTEQVQAERLLEQRVEDRTRELTTLLDVARNVAATIEMEPLLHVILQQVQKVAPYDRAAFLLRDGDGLVVTAVEIHGDRFEPIALPGEVNARFGPQTVDRLGVTGPTIIPDVHADTPEARAYRDTMDPAMRSAVLDGIRSWMGVPLGHKGKVTGMLALASAEPAFYTQQHVDLVVAIASHAAVTVENARLFERAELRTQELATLLDVAKDVASTIELQPLLQLILDQVGKLAPYQRAGFALLDGDELVITAVTGATPPMHDEMQYQVGVRMPASGALWDRVARGEAVILQDIKGDSREARQVRRAMELSGVVGDLELQSSWLVVPVSAKDAVIGMLTLSHDTTNYYTERHAELAMAIASQAAVAIENARLFASVDERTRELSALLNVSNSIASTLELDALVAVILEQLEQIVETDPAALLVYDGDHMEVIQARSNGAYPEDMRGIRFAVDAANPIWRAMIEQTHIMVADTHSDDPAAVAFREVVAPLWERSFSGFHSWLGVPLVHNGRLVGQISIGHRDVARFDESDVRLVRAFADQAAVAVANARLFESVKARTRELSALLDVSKSVASQLELGPLLEVMLQQLRNVVEHSGASLLMLSSDGQALNVMEPDRDGTGLHTRTSFTFEHSRVFWDAMQRREIVIIDDARGDSELAQAFRRAVGARYERTARPVRSWMAVPVALQDRVIGMLGVAHDRPNAFDEESGSLVQTVANQTAVAIENARLFASVQERTRELSALLDVSKGLASTLDLRELVGIILDQVCNVIDYTGSSVMSLEDDGSLVILGAHSVQGRDDEIGARFRVHPRNAIWREISQLRTVIVGDIHDEEEPLARAYRATLGPAIERDAYKTVRAWMGVPLAVNDRLIGMMSMSRTEPGYFTGQHAQLALLVANQAAMAMENARLYAQAQELAAVEERQRLARELHDSVSQALYGIALGARTARTLLDRDAEKAVEPMDYVLSLAEAGLAEMRALIFELRPESLELEGLVVGIEKQAAAMRARHNVEVDAELCDEPDISLAIKEALARIAQESLHNIIKHARATKVVVRLAHESGAATLEIEDNGSGFDPNGTFAGHLGLRSMRERVAKFGGSIDIDSAPGEGTRIRVKIPVSAPEPVAR